MRNSSKKKDTDALKNARERLLVIAGELFAKHGREGLSVREITAAANVNLAAINYHFGSKDGLFYAVCVERIQQGNIARLNLLDKVKRSMAPAVPSVEQVLECYMRPVTQLLFSDDTLSLLTMRMIMNEFNDAKSPLHKLARDEIQPFLRNYAEALRRALNVDDIESVVWGLTFSTGMMLHTMICADKLALFFPEMRGANDPEKILQMMISHCAGGLRALVKCK